MQKTRKTADNNIGATNLFFIPSPLSDSIGFYQTSLFIGRPSSFLQREITQFSK
ncbi:Hypothetical protein ACI5QL_03677 [Bacillus velezensis]|nr:hypothetical protein B4140_3962 [Bacillus amyloliquefaciens]QEY90182.1 hypothetical protein BACIT_2289 [Bacillus amyloliquefaciens]RAP18610.1 hypothetical protein C2W63_02787 [Bacillus velezensis]RUR98406.1 hypothetical protein EFW57_02780 [Bacillus velezensis]